MNVLSCLKHSTFRFAKILFWASLKFLSLALHQSAQCCHSFLTIHPLILSHFFLTIIDSSALPIIQLKLPSHLAPIPATSSLTHHLSPQLCTNFNPLNPPYTLKLSSVDFLALQCPGPPPGPPLLITGHTLRLQVGDGPWCSPYCSLHLVICGLGSTVNIR